MAWNLTRTSMCWLGVISVSLIVASGCGLNILDNADDGNPANNNALALDEVRVTGSNNIGGLVVVGAPLTGVTIEVKDLSGRTVADDIVSDANSFFQAYLDPANAPYILEVEDASVMPAKTYKTIVLYEDFSADERNINITPITTLVTELLQRGSGIVAGASRAAVRQARQDSLVVVESLLAPFLERFELTQRGESLLRNRFIPVQDNIDRLFEAFDFVYDDDNCSVIPTSQVAYEGMEGGIRFPLNNLAFARQEIDAVVPDIPAESIEAISRSFPVVIVMSQGREWQESTTAADNSYSGRMAIYNFSDQPIYGGSSIAFQGQFRARGMWNGYLTEGGNNTYRIDLPDWSSVPAFAGATGRSFVIGFTGVGAPSDVLSLTGCTIGGRRCLFLVDRNSSPMPDVTGRFILTSRSWSSFLESVQSFNTTAASVPVTVPNAIEGFSPERNTPLVDYSLVPADSTGTATNLPVRMMSKEIWNNGLSVSLTIDNTSDRDWSEWRLSFDFPSTIRSFIGRNSYESSSLNSNLLIASKSWNGVVRDGHSITMGMNIVGQLPTVPDGSDANTVIAAAFTNCQVIATIAGEAVTIPCTLSFDGSQAVEIPYSVPTGTAALTPTSHAVALQHAGLAKGVVLTADNISSVDTTTRYVVGHYLSSSDNLYTLPDEVVEAADVFKASRLSRISPTFTHIVLQSVNPSTLNFTAGQLTWIGTGLQFPSNTVSVKHAITALQNRGMKVLLGLGGPLLQTADWAGMAAEEVAGTPGRYLNSLQALMTHFNFDGIELDYRITAGQLVANSQFARIVAACRRVLNTVNGLAARDGNPTILALAASPSGADCSTALSELDECTGESTVTGPAFAGRELFAFSNAWSDAYDDDSGPINMINIRSFEVGGNRNYDPVKAWRQYRDLFPTSVAVNIGLKMSPEEGGGILVVRNADADCTLALVANDQYGVAVNAPYSVERLVSAVITGSTAPSRDGVSVVPALDSNKRAMCNSDKTPGVVGILTEIARLTGAPSPLLVLDE